MRKKTGQVWGLFLPSQMSIDIYQTAIRRKNARWVKNNKNILPCNINTDLCRRPCSYWNSWPTVQAYNKSRPNVDNKWLILTSWSHVWRFKCISQKEIRQKKLARNTMYGDLCSYSHKIQNGHSGRYKEICSCPVCTTDFAQVLSERFYGPHMWNCLQSVRN